MLSSRSSSEPTRESGRKARLRIAVALATVGLLILATIILYGGKPESRDLPLPSEAEIHLTCETNDEQRPCVFAPDAVSVRPGALVRWINHEAVFHTITSTDSLEIKQPNGQFDRNVFQVGETFEFVFAEAGTFHYYCQTHSEFMFGTVLVG